jgi:cobyrinic acid a,c-diamide synthase
MNDTRKLKVEKKAYPRLIIAALRGSSAKTLVSLGIIVALRKKGYRIVPFKKGPDYIVAAWLGKAAGGICRHLDLYLMHEKGVQNLFYSHLHKDAIAVVEGNRGLFDGVDMHGTYSTARIARLLEIPVILIVDCSKVTNTVVPLIIGCQVFDSNVPLRGVILNHVAGKRHGTIIRNSVEYHTDLPVLGLLPELDIQLPERHLGLTTVNETGDFEQKLDVLGDIAEKYLNLTGVLRIAKNASPLPRIAKAETMKATANHTHTVLVGIIRDPAFQFYYPENLEALQREGATIIEFDSMRDKKIKPVDLLYIAGGFPEVHAGELSKNTHFYASIKAYAEKGMPVYGECGAVIYLGSRVNFEGKKYDMCGIFPLEFEFTRKPAGHGYTEVIVDRENPFFPTGETLRGHEFHYSLPGNWNSALYNTAFSVRKGFGMGGSRDGLFTKNVFATYTHIHAAGCENWAKWLIAAARKINFTQIQ